MSRSSRQSTSESRISSGSPNSVRFSTVTCSTIKTAYKSPVQLSSPGTISQTIRCRICLESEDKGEMITPCNCSGTIGSLHKGCLEEWINVAKNGYCEICRCEFKVKLSQPTIKTWLIGHKIGADRNQRRHICIDLFCLCVTIPLVSLCTWFTIGSIATYGFQEFHFEVIALIIIFLFLITIFIFWFTLSFRYHYRSFITWQENVVSDRLGFLNQVIVTPGSRTDQVDQGRFLSKSSSSLEDSRPMSTGSATSNHSGLFPTPIPPKMDIPTSSFSKRFSVASPSGREVIPRLNSVNSVDEAVPMLPNRVRLKSRGMPNSSLSSVHDSFL